MAFSSTISDIQDFISLNRLQSHPEIKLIKEVSKESLQEFCLWRKIYSV